MNYNAVFMTTQFVFLGISILAILVALIMLNIGKGKEVRDKLYYTSIISLILFFTLPYTIHIFI